MIRVTVHKAKTALSQLLAAAEAGEEIVICRGAEPVARLVPVHPRRRSPGALAGEVRVDDSFFEPLPPEELAAWEG
jgi:prevent-host-death family protein